MARIDPLPMEALAEHKEHLQLIEQASGYVPNSMRTMARVPGLLDAFYTMVATVLRNTVLSRELTQMISLMASKTAGCRYCQAHTAYGATRLGVAEEKVVDIWSFETSEHFDEAERAALRLAVAGAAVIGIDMAEGPLAVARLHQHESEAKVDYRQATAEELAAEAPDSFDVVTCLEMLEHVPDPAQVIQSCAELVKPGGHVFFSTINRNPKSFAFAIVGAEYVLKLLPAGTHEYEKFIRPSELEAWARRADLTLMDSIGMHYNPLTQNYWLDEGLDVNYLMVFQRD